MHDTVVPSDLRADAVTEVPVGRAPPEIEGVESDVRLSVGDAPVSDESTRSGDPRDGAELSIVMDNAGLAADTLPARSVATVETDHTPSLKTGKSQLVTETDTTYVHDTVVPSDLRADAVTEVPAGRAPP